jgi:hypothetical protein
MLRRQNLPALTFLGFLSFVAVCGIVTSNAQSPFAEEREVVEKIPKHLPIKVKIKKPEMLKDAKNEDWLGDVELEITNTGTKPIYYLHISVYLPDVVSPRGHNYGFNLEYGRTALAALDVPIRPDDVPIRPDEVVILKVPANNAQAWKLTRANGKAANPKKLEFIFDYLNFGDGTGYVGSTGKSLPEIRERGANGSCPGGDKAGEVKSVMGPPRYHFPETASLANYLPPPANLAPAFFLGKPTSPAPASQDLCCTSPCSRIKLTQTRGVHAPR